jgi:hypothetical protein
VLTDRTADDGAVTVGAVAEFAVVVHPGMRSFYYPALAHLNGIGIRFFAISQTMSWAARTSLQGRPS